MDIETYRDFCLTFPEVTECFPFDDKVLVFKVANKMFALADVDEFKSINLKCDPERSIVLREEYSEINPGYHMNKKHWNTIEMKGDLDNEFIQELIVHSYDLVVASLSKKIQAQINPQQ